MNLLAKYIKKHHDGSETAFARASGIPQPMVWAYSAGTSRPGLDHAFTIEKVTTAAGDPVPAAYWTTIKPKPRNARKSA